MLFFYNLREFLKAFLLLSFVFASILSLYSVFDVLFLYKTAKVELIPKVLLTTILISFYYTAPIVNSLSLMLYLRRVFSKSYDRIASTFGISPFSFFFPVLLVSLLLSFIQFVLSYSFYPKIFKTAYSLEREFKKSKPAEEFFISDLWLSLSSEGNNYYIRIGFANLKDKRVHNVFLVSLKESDITELITAEEGYWEDKSLRLRNAEINIFEREIQKRADLSVEIIPVEEAKAFGEKLNHLSMDRLISLYVLAGKVGMNKELYLAEILRRAIVSFSNIVILSPLLLSLIRHRAFLKPSVFLLLYASVYVLSLNLVKVVAEEFGKNPFIGLIPFLGLCFLSLRNLYYLSKG
ncbi:LptF/LptG family permease [Thermocrinis jamiesonii]|uniref:LptF/LptG family permease n=1 Tax=Thermocrinis jamiesonii TaxID=1302351 RepID=UPI00049609AD|nr:LptF/LptG family permease [Thermocrinis jamiesonii]